MKVVNDKNLSVIWNAIKQKISAVAETKYEPNHDEELDSNINIYLNNEVTPRIGSKSEYSCLYNKFVDVKLTIQNAESSLPINSIKLDVINDCELILGDWEICDLNTGDELGYIEIHTNGDCELFLHSQPSVQSNNEATISFQYQYLLKEAI